MFQLGLPMIKEATITASPGVRLAHQPSSSRWHATLIVTWNNWDYGPSTSPALVSLLAHSPTLPRMQLCAEHPEASSK